MRWRRNAHIPRLGSFGGLALIALSLTSVSLLLQWHSKPHTIERVLFTGLAALPRYVRVTLMGWATGTRGSNVVYYSSSTRQMAALTIDDVPSQSAGEFEALLRLLATHNMTATLSVIASYAASHEPVLRQAVAHGHMLLNHGVTDDPQTGQTQSAFKRQLEQCQAVITRIDPSASKWYRPPSGMMDFNMRTVLREQGYRVVLGDCYSADPQVLDVAFHVELLSSCARAGSVLILHSPERGHRHQTLQIVIALAGRLRLELVTVDQLFADQPMDFLN